MSYIKKYSSTLKTCPVLPNEIWKIIPGYNNRYSVSNLGRVWSDSTCRILTIFPTNLGYCRVNFTTNGKCNAHLLHRLVAQAFIQNPDNKPEVNHKDGDKSNNKSDNLEWSTSSENKIHAREIGILSMGTSRPDAKVNEFIVEQILEDRFKNSLTQEHLANKYNISRTAIRNIINRKTWKHVPIPELLLINMMT